MAAAALSTLIDCALTRRRSLCAALLSPLCGTNCPQAGESGGHSPMSASALSRELQGLLSGTGALLSELCDGAAVGATDAAVPGLFQSFSALRKKSEQDELTVAVLALAKAGEDLRHVVGGRGSCSPPPPDTLPLIHRSPFAGHCLQASPP